MIDPGGVTAAVLAAGFSRRLGRPKQLLDYRGKPLLQWAIDAALGVGFSEVLVVLGEAAPAILERVDFGAARVIVNERAVEGQSSSIFTTVANADPRRTGTLLMLGDQPGVTSDDLNRILVAFDGNPESIVMASWQGEARSPVIFGRAYDRELLDLTGDTGARPLIRKHPDNVRFVEFDRPVPLDIDTESDYLQLISEDEAST